MLFVFNMYSALLLPAVIQCLLFAFLSALRLIREKRKSDLYLALLLLVTGIKLSFWMLGFAGWYDSHDGYTTFMFYFPFSIYLTAGPLVYFYFKSITNIHFRLTKKDWPHLVLPFLFILLILVKYIVDFTAFYPFPATVDYQFGTRGPYAELDKSHLVTLLGFGSFFFYLLLTLKNIPKYKQYVSENFANNDQLNLGWFQYMLLAIFLGVFILFGFWLWEWCYGEITYKVDWYGYIALGILSYYIVNNGYYFRSRQLYQLDFVPAAALPVAGSAIVSSVEDQDIWREKLDRLMETTKPFLRPELSLTDLATLLGTNKTVLSKVINSNYRENFNDYINRYRVNQFIEKVNKGAHDELTLLSIAYDCGFNSKATFNRAFKKMTGKTPKMFIKGQETQE
ncbi:AraC family transcriptional regulator [Chitinophaga sp.]|uniref:helix-turn-helix domain-containing protein n=1 Tax=Chitinophaga sp. TaxID=1869181 RepID=UPI0031CF57A3